MVSDEFLKKISIKKKAMFMQLTVRKIKLPWVRTLEPLLPCYTASFPNTK